MTRLSEKHGGVNLSQGFPDFAAPAAVKEAACAAINADVNQYAVTWGARPLREAIARAFTSRYGVEVVADEQVTVCCGATEAMMSTMMAIIDPGDEVDRLRAVLRELRAGRHPVRRDAALRDAARAGLDVSIRTSWRPRSTRRRRRSSSTRRTTRRARSSRAQELETIAALCQKWDAIAISDEIYEHIIYDGRRHVPIATIRGHGRAHRDDQQPVEDLQRHGLAGGLDDFAAVADRARSGRCTTSSPSARRRRCRKPAPSRWRCRTSITLDLAAKYQRLPRRAARHPRAAPLHVLPPVRRVLHHDGHRRASASETTSSSRGIW